MATVKEAFLKSYQHMDTLDMILILNNLTPTDLQEEVCRREDPKTDGEKGPAFHEAFSALIIHELLADLTVNLIPDQVEKGKNSKTQC